MTRLHLLHGLHVELWPDVGDILEPLWFYIFSPTICGEDRERDDNNEFIYVEVAWSWFVYLQQHRR